MHEYHLDLNHPAFVADPYPLLAEVRERTPVFFDPGWGKVFFARYDDIAALLATGGWAARSCTCSPATSWAGRRPTP